MKKFSRKYSLDYILECLESLKDLKALVVGEAIIDEYQFGSTIGKSAKEPIIALQYIKKELYPGGSLAVANHLAGFCKEVGLFAMLGEKDSQERFIRRNLKKNIKPMFFYKKDSPTIVKRRFLEDVTFRKLLEFYVIDESELSKEQTDQQIKKLKPLLSKYDLVVCSDFGHGMLNQKSRDLLTKKAKFLSVNTQANAGNFGYHTISFYPKADFLCLDEREIRLECKTKDGELEEVAKSIFEKVRSNYMIVTHGPNGSIGYKNKKSHTAFLEFPSLARHESKLSRGLTRKYKSQIEVCKVPSFAIKDIDKVGAGDAFFAISSPLIYNKVPLELVCFIGNAVGALAIDIIGNKESITKKDLVSFIENILT